VKVPRMQDQRRALVMLLLNEEPKNELAIPSLSTIPSLIVLYRYPDVPSYPKPHLIRGLSFLPLLPRRFRSFCPFFLEPFRATILC
jgi:hypothetical protein